MKQPTIHGLTGTFQFLDAPTDALRRVVAAPYLNFVPGPGEPENAAAITKSIAVHIVRERDQ